MLSMEEAKIRVARGAAHLDAVRPNWFTQIDVGTLTLHDPCGCIVGQLCGTGSHFNIGRMLLGLTKELGITHGFNLRNGEGTGRNAGSYQALQDAWIAAIADRRLAQLQQYEEDARRVGRGESAGFGTASPDSVVSDNGVSSDPCIEVTR